MPQYNVKRENLLKLMPANSVCAELGVGRGVFSKEILKIANPNFLYCVDLWGPIATNIQGKYYTDQTEWDKRFEDIQTEFLGKPVKFIRDLTYNLPNYCAEKTLDWAYIDGDHTYDGCMKDLQAVKSLIKDNGMILGHDYRPAWKRRSDWGVVESVNDFVAENNYFLTVVTKEKYPSFIITKTRSKHEEILSLMETL